MNRPLLSICIPTYNRASYLPQCLDSIISQIDTDELRPKTEIVISDNASTDNTTEVVEGYKQKYPNITIVYFRNEKNIGFDRSFAKLIDTSRGEYCFSIGDDDAFFEGVIPKIIDRIANGNTPFYGVNCWGYDIDLKNAVLSHPNLVMEKDLHFEKLSDYIQSIKKYANLVGVFVGLSTQLFKRDPWSNYQGREKFFDTLAIHMYVNLSVFKDSPFEMIAEPMIKTRSSNIRWDVFAGLETIKGRIKSTLQIATWIRDMYSLPISNLKLKMYFYTREYWFTYKEVAKMRLQKMGLGKIISIYRKIRS